MTDAARRGVARGVLGFVVPAAVGLLIRRPNPADTYPAALSRDWAAGALVLGGVAVIGWAARNAEAGQ